MKQSQTSLFVSRFFFFNKNSPHTIFPRLTFFCTTFPLGLRFADDLPCDWRRRIDLVVIQPFSRNALIRSAWFFHETTEKKKKRKKTDFSGGCDTQTVKAFRFFPTLPIRIHENDPHTIQRIHCYVSSNVMVHARYHSDELLTIAAVGCVVVLITDTIPLRWGSSWWLRGAGGGGMGVSLQTVEWMASKRKWMNSPDWKMCTWKRRCRPRANPAPPSISIVCHSENLKLPSDS